MINVVVDEQGILAGARHGRWHTLRVQDMGWRDTPLVHAAGHGVEGHTTRTCTTVERDGSRGSDAGRLRNGPGGASCKRWVRHYLPREDIFRAGVRG